jgi:hypothetical protein
MTTILGDNTVIPSYLGVSTRGAVEGAGDSLNDNVLRLGEIRKVIYPQDPLNFNKKQTEYEVEVHRRNGNGATVSSLYRGVTVNNSLAGLADRYEVTFRPDTTHQGRDEEEPVGVGSKVLICCIAGDNQKAIILGGIRNATIDKRVDTKDDGHNLFFEFNGVRFIIDKLGQPTFTFRGATKYDGTLVDSALKEAEGTSVKISDAGTFTVATPDDQQFFRLDHGNHMVEMLADEQWKVTVNKGTYFNIGDIFKIESDGVWVGAATEKWMMGSTFRDEQKALHETLASKLQAAAAQAQSAGIKLTSAAATNAIPTVGPGKAASDFSAAATALIQLAAALGDMASAIKKFEARDPDYLSKKNLND